MPGKVAPSKKGPFLTKRPLGDLSVDVGRRKEAKQGYSVLEWDIFFAHCAFCRHHSTAPLIEFNATDYFNSNPHWAYIYPGIMVVGVKEVIWKDIFLYCVK